MLVLSVVLVGCTSTKTTTSNIAESQELPTDLGLTSDATTSVVLSEYSFGPSEIVLQAGVSNSIELSNQGSIPHTFVVTDLGIDVSLGVGESQTITVDNPAPGSYEVLCTVAGHSELGMHGQVTVR